MLQVNNQPFVTARRWENAGKGIWTFSEVRVFRGGAATAARTQTRCAREREFLLVGLECRGQPSRKGFPLRHCMLTDQAQAAECALRTVFLSAAGVKVSSLHQNSISQILFVSIIDTCCMCLTKSRRQQRYVRQRSVDRKSCRCDPFVHAVLALKGRK